MGLDYLKGSELSYVNSERLSTSARIILKDELGTDAFAMFLHYIAYEEMAKSVYCIMLHKGLLDEQSEYAVFKDHKVKIFLCDEILRSFKGDKSGSYTLGGKPLGAKTLKEFVKEHEKSITQHRNKTNDFLYVNKTEKGWYHPSFKLENLEKEVEEIEEKIALLSIIRHMLMKDIRYKFDKVEYTKNSQGQDTVKFIDTKKS